MSVEQAVPGSSPVPAEICTGDAGHKDSRAPESTGGRRRRRPRRSRRPADAPWPLGGVRSRVRFPERIPAEWATTSHLTDAQVREQQQQQQQQVWSGTQLNPSAKPFVPSSRRTSAVASAAAQVPAPADSPATKPKESLEPNDPSQEGAGAIELCASDNCLACAGADAYADGNTASASENAASSKGPGSLAPDGAVPGNGLDMSDTAVHDSAGSEAADDVKAADDVEAAESAKAAESTEVAESTKAAENAKAADVAETPEAAGEAWDVGNGAPAGVTGLECADEDVPAKAERAASSLRVLTSSEIVGLYSGDSCAPALSGGTLCYPPAFLERFRALCVPPPSLQRSLTDEMFGGIHDVDAVARPALQRPGSFQRSQTLDGREPRSGGFRRTRTFGSAPSLEASPSRDGRVWRNAGSSSSSHREAEAAAAPAPDVKPLAKSAGRYIPRSLRAGAPEDDDAREREIRALLNKLSPDNFDTVSDKLLACANQTASEADSSTLRVLVALVFAKAADEHAWMEMYGRLCVKLIQQTSDDVVGCAAGQDGKPLRGGRLVRACLLRQCQHEFERGWAAEDAATTTSDLRSDEYCEAAATRRRGLGTAHFIGELFQLDVVSADIIYGCLAHLLPDAGPDTPDTAKTETAMRLLEVAGKKLDVPSGNARLDRHMARLQALSQDQRLPQPVRYRLMNAVDLRRDGWVPRIKREQAKTSAEVHTEIQLGKAASARPGVAARPSLNTSASTYSRGEPQRAGDLSRFGNLSRSRQSAGAMALGRNPFGAFAGGSRGWGAGAQSPPRVSPLALARSASGAAGTPRAPPPVRTSNTFDVLAGDGDHGSNRGASEAAPDPAALQRRVRAAISEYVEGAPEADLAAAFAGLDAASLQVAVCEAANVIVDCRAAHVERIAGGMALLREHRALPEDAVVAGLAEYGACLEDVVLDAPDAYLRFGLLAAAARVPLARMPEVLRALDADGPTAAVVAAYLERLVESDGRAQTRAAIAAAGLGATQLGGAAAQGALGLRGLLDLFD
ncbi:hypothetical protein H4R18_005434 [Coemansia javaensis]|uniref:MIF4G domain-containing protein n=1 Tax=Coemansia javaensis TaxID=2761396 RepID=A0A9W8LET6_9FUNG|nr:hypothetical protein H4R18_005434 [Coemansia javaensis]